MRWALALATAARRAARSSSGSGGRGSSASLSARRAPSTSPPAATLALRARGRLPVLPAAEEAADDLRGGARTESSCGMVLAWVVSAVVACSCSSSTAAVPSAGGPAAAASRTRGAPAGAGKRLRKAKGLQPGGRMEEAALPAALVASARSCPSSSCPSLQTGPT